MDPIPAPAELGDLILSIIYIPIILAIALKIQHTYIDQNPIYKYFTLGLFVKIFGGMTLCLVYLFYYKGGDTIDFFNNSVSLVNLIGKDVEVFFSILFGNTGDANKVILVESSGMSNYMWGKDRTYLVVRLISPLVLLSCKYIIPTTILLATISYYGIWKLYLLFCDSFPSLSREFAVSILFLPSVVFWGSGILKDTITFSAIALFVYCFYTILMKRRNVFINVTQLFIASALILYIKPYIFLTLIPATIFCTVWHFTTSLTTLSVKLIAGPLLVVLLGTVSYWLFTSILGDAMGDYRLDKFAGKAFYQQQGLMVTRVYGANFFNIGADSNSLLSMLFAAPFALGAALFRPFLWEANNTMMFISALENACVFLFTLWMIYKIGIKNLILFVGRSPLLVFSISFCLIFALGVGFSTPNFGALVRYKIPAMPFFMAALFMLKHYADSSKKLIELSSASE